MAGDRHGPDGGEGRRGDGPVGSARHERVAADSAGQRLDNFVLRHAPGVPRSRLYRLIRTGAVRVDGKRAKPTRRLVEGERVRLPALDATRRGPARVPDALAARLARAIAREHEDFLVLAKPAGVAVHRGSGLAFGAIDALRQALDAPSLELVHRLDRDTSGALLVARDRARARALQDLFRRRQVEKGYLALVAGHWPRTLGRVDAPLARNVAHAGERRVVVDAEGRAAVSRFAVRRRFADATLLDVAIDTGRTHQIRVHARHAGHAVVGDRRYGDNRVNAAFRRRGLGRLFLHAHRLAFDWRGERVVIEVPADADWERALERLPGSDRGTRSEPPR